MDNQNTNGQMNVKVSGKRESRMQKEMEIVGDREMGMLQEENTTNRNLDGVHNGNVY